MKSLPSPTLPSMDAALADLFEAASIARAHAYAPYSKFPVGAALRTATGRIFAAANVENAAYPVGSCAETGAIAAMIATGERAIVAVLVVAGGDRMVTPCGACRQRLAEFGTPATTIHCAGPDGLRASFALGDLLPQAFHLAKTVPRDPDHP